MVSPGMAVARSGAGSAQRPAVLPLLSMWISTLMFESTDRLFPLKIGVVFSDRILALLPDRISGRLPESHGLVAGKQCGLVIGEQLGLVAGRSIAMSSAGRGWCRGLLQFLLDRGRRLRRWPGSRGGDQGAVSPPAG